MKKALSAAVIAAAVSAGGSGVAFGQTPAPAPRATPGAAEHHDQAPEDPFRLQPLSGGVYALYGRGGNVGFFVGPDAVLVVDSQFKELAPGIVRQIQKVSDKPIRFLLNTHHHGDHVGGNEVFRPFAMIVAHDNVRTRMLASPVDIARDYPALIEHARAAGDERAAKSMSDQLAWAKTVKVEEIAAPVMTFESSLKIHMGDETIHVWHLPPAHTDGDSVVWFEKAKVLHMGDDFFNQVIPFIDVKSGGSVTGYLAAIDRAISKIPSDARIIPGHGEVTDVKGLQGFRAYIADVLDAARKAKAAGKSKDAFTKEVSLPAYQEWSGYKDRFAANAASAWDEAK
ncbi:MAG: MBL fold metallo-hydrolase [Acidobacteria bacterium]|nr:MBL fold metallo-hydrolase [Acidobacteriota bacterium]